MVTFEIAGVVAQDDHLIVHCMACFSSMGYNWTRLVKIGNHYKMDGCL
jgi:hypothetical protein